MESKDARKNSHQREAIQLQFLWQEIQAESPFEKARADSFQLKSFLQSVQEFLPATKWLEETHKESSWDKHHIQYTHS